MNSNKQWKDLFNQKPINTSKKSDLMILDDIIRSNGHGLCIKDSIPQSVIKKSRKDANKK